MTGALRAREDTRPQGGAAPADVRCHFAPFARGVDALPLPRSDAR